MPNSNNAATGLRAPVTKRSVSKRGASAWGAFCGSVLLLLGVAASAQGGAARGKALPATKPIVIQVRLQLTGKAALAAKDITYSHFPQGRRCAFSYIGVRSSRNVAFLHKLGFRTTMYLSPLTPAKHVKALEDAGAEIACLQPSLVGLSSYKTVQESYDMVTSGRRALQAKCRGPVICTYPVIGGQHSDASTFALSLNRGIDGQAHTNGYGAAFLDSNYRYLYDYWTRCVLYLTRGADDQAVLVDKQDNTHKAGRKPPNEAIYYMLLANQFDVALKHVKPGTFVLFKLRDFKQADLEALGRIIGKYGKKPLIWHATQGEIAAYDYLKRKTQVVGVKSIGPDGLEVTLALDADLFSPHLLAPLSLRLPKAFPVKGARVGPTACDITVHAESVHVDIPVAKVLRDGCGMALKTAAPNMEVPGQMQATLTIRNTSDKAMVDVALRWVGCPGIKGGEGLTVTSEGATGLTLAPGAEHKFKTAIRTVPGARFGLTPIQAILTAKVGGVGRTFAQGFEVAVAPRVRLHQDPYWGFGMRKGDSQTFLVNLSNERERSHYHLGYGRRLPTFLSHKAGPCKGVVRFDLPKGMSVEPKERRFELAADSKLTLAFTVTNREWAKGKFKVRPVVQFDGDATPSEIPFPGSTVLRGEKLLAYKPVDEKGLLFYLPWDKHTDATKSAGSPGHWSGDIPTYLPAIGVKGMCNSYPAWSIHSPFKNIYNKKGTVLFWVRKHPKSKNENGYVPDRANTWKMGPRMGPSRGEAIFGNDVPCQPLITSQGFVGLRRYRSWRGKPGYVEAVLRCLGNVKYHVQAPFEWESRWRHAAILWDTEARRLEIYLDGKLVSGPLHRDGKPVPKGDKAVWHSAPWDGAYDHFCMMPALGGHNGWYGTDRDEFYIYNRPLTVREIQGNMKASMAGPQKE